MTTWPPSPYVCSTNCENPQTSFGIGWNQDGDAGYFSESAGGGYDTRCADVSPGPESPCILVDWDYSSDQLYTALVGYVLSGYDAWWQRIVTGEFNTLLPRITGSYAAGYYNLGGYLDTSAGSRHTCCANGGPPPPFFDGVYAVLDEHNVIRRDDLWSGQQADFSRWLGWTIGKPPSQYTPSYYDMTISTQPAIAVLDAETTR